MKRHGHLWERLCSFESLLCAAEQARRGKRFRPGVAAFHYHLETALCRILRELEKKDRTVNGTSTGSGRLSITFHARSGATQAKVTGYVPGLGAISSTSPGLSCSLAMR
jgi:hypothetical protein